MRTRTSTSLVLALALGLVVPNEVRAKSKTFTDSFMTETCTFSADGTNPYFPLTPGYRLVLETDPARRRGEHVVLTVTVLAETVVVDGVTTRVVEEHETADGTLVEISRNFFAVCQENGSLFYFGEDVDNYDETGTTVINHDGAWRAGVAGARAGVNMPGLPLIGSRYFQEVAPGIALDRAEITSTTEVVTTPAGTFEGCVVTKESSALERKAKSAKTYAPGIGMIRDDDLALTQSGFVP